MPKGKSDKLVFKPYEQKQPWLVPPSADELIAMDHLVRVVNSTIEEMNLEPLLLKYTKGGGASRFHPVMLFKVVVYGYMTGVYSSRKLARAVRENILFMWLAGNQKPDFRTINGFRSSRLKGIMDEVFMATVKLLAAKGYVKLENYFVDGTKIESASGRYTFVWKRAVMTNEKKLDEKLKAYIRQAERVSEEENKEYGDRDLEEVGEGIVFSAEDVKALAETLNEKIRALGEDGEAKNDKKKLKREVRTIERELLPRKEKYEEYRAVAGDRKSFSKTDHDATFMRMKEDHMRNGQLKPGYNVQIGTENGFVLGYDIYSNPTDTKTLKPHLEKVEALWGKVPERVIADAGYGSHENYEMLAEKKVEAYVKYGMFDKDRQYRKSASRKYGSDTWEYVKEKDCYICPEGEELKYFGSATNKTDAGYEQTLRMYKCTSCEACSQRILCAKGRRERQVQRNEKLLELQRMARERLMSENGVRLRKRRAHENETVFGQIKSNKGFRRFQLRGMEKVKIEWGLLAIGYNLEKLGRKMVRG
jgi:transposase